MDRPQAPVVGEPIPPEAWGPRAADPRALMAWLRETTLALGQPPGRGSSGASSSGPGGS